MISCENCLWLDRCFDSGEVCDFYDSLIGIEELQIQEYEIDLKNREYEYQKIIDEFNK